MGCPVTASDSQAGGALKCEVTSHTAIAGYLGRRLHANVSGILSHKDEDGLLRPFRERGRSKDVNWLGEHVGKWLSGAAMSYRWTQDERLGGKLRRVAHALIDTQLEDGYLGSYVDEDRWTNWDVWTHKYNLLGLLDYHEATGDERALDASRRMGDLVCDTFGLDSRDLIRSGENVGMAATSILEPMMRLYGHTGEKRYLDFGRYVVAAIEQDNGPKIISALSTGKDIRDVANAKAYEMLSTIVGLIELYKHTGDEKLLRIAIRAADNVIDDHLYITGGCSFGERFLEPGRFPNAGYVAETCVTMTLIQLYRELLLITGDLRYAGAAEHLVFNHLLAHQHPTGENVCYYTSLWGHKTYMDFLGCCISSGPRALSMIPDLVYLRRGNTVIVNILAQGSAQLELDGGRSVRISQQTDYPFDGKFRIVAETSSRDTVLAIRVPDCANNPDCLVNGIPRNVRIQPGRLLEVPLGKGTTTAEIDLHLNWRLIEGKHANAGLFALQHGPVVFACEHVQSGPRSGGETTGPTRLQDPPDRFLPAFDMDVGSLAPRVEQRDGQWAATVDGYLRDDRGEWRPGRLRLVPFADAGLEDRYFTVWLQDRERINPVGRSLYTGISEKTSRVGKHTGSLADNDTATFASTDDGSLRDEDSFELHGGWYTRYNVIVFRHGRNLPHGGWFDTSKGKPNVWIKTWHDYELIGELDDYPATTASDAGDLRDAQAFFFVIPPEHRSANFTVRVTGAPSHGNDPKQNCSSCSELQVFYVPALGWK